MNRHALIFFPVLALAGITTACDDFNIDMGGEKFEAPFHYSYDVKAGAHMDLETFNGSIEVRAWDQNKVDVSGTKYAGSEALRNAIRIDASGSPNGVILRAVRPAERHGSMGANFVVRVPREVNLDRIIASNGAIRVEDVDGPVHVQTSNGALHLAHLRGAVDGTTSNGAIEISEVTGRSILNTSNGHIEADHVTGQIDATTMNSAITISFEASPKNDVKASTSNGSITIHMPATSGARIRAATSNSSINTDFQVASQGETTKNNLQGTVNGGGALLDLTTSNGAIHVLKP